VLTLGGGANVYGSYHSLVGQEAGTALLATMLTLKLLEVRSARDLRMTGVLFGFLLVTQFLFSQSPWLLLYLTAVTVANFALMVDLTARLPGPRVGSALRLAGRLSAQALPLALVLFVLFPRLDAPLWNLHDPATRARTGISDQLEPGAVSELVIDGGLAFRARFDGAAPSADGLYWRGPVLWNSDGRRWLPGHPSGGGAIRREPASAADLVSYTVVMERSGQRWLFALDLPLVAPPAAALTADHTLLADRPVEETRAYRAASALTYDTGPLADAERTAALTLPGNLTQRMRDLVAGWQAESAGPEALVQRALSFFREEPFHYTLLPPLLGPSPADEFLFETRRGFCEHYASAFALLMRIGGIPSRILVGYLGGELNPMAGHYIVRHSDAHAWVEVWLEGRGWVRIDPTAAVAPWRVERAELPALAGGTPLRFRGEPPETLVRWVHRLRLLADAADARWHQWVLNYSSLQQMRLLDRAGLGGLREYGLAVAMVLSAALVLGLLVAAMSRGERRRDPAERLYAGFCRRLAKIGLRPRPGEGPRDFGRRAAARRPELGGAIDGFLSAYLPLRYGPPPGGPHLREAAVALRALRPRRRRGKAAPAGRPS
jgi:transglutaminase-like putative cysteine protease